MNILNIQTALPNFRKIPLCLCGLRVCGRGENLTGMIGLLTFKTDLPMDR
jgi:hypothetical protein